LSTESRELFFGAREIRQRSSGKEEGKKLNEINFPLSISKMRFRFLFGYGMIHILLVAASFRLGRLDRPQRSRVRIAGEVFFSFFFSLECSECDSETSTESLPRPTRCNERKKANQLGRETFFFHLTPAIITGLRVSSTCHV
jgi:hypothetical protein